MLFDDGKDISMEKEKKKGGVIGWLLLFLIFIAAGYLLKTQMMPGIGHETVIETQTLKSELVKISELATYQKEYRETIEKEKDGFFSQRYFATYDGVIKAGINMENVDVTVKEPEEKGEKTVVDVTLPDAEILTHTDDNWEVVYEDGYQDKEIGDERNKIIKEEKKKVDKQFIEEGGLDKASEKAKEVIEDFIKSAYGENVIVTFNGEEAQK